MTHAKRNHAFKIQILMTRERSHVTYRPITMLTHVGNSRKYNDRYFEFC